MVKTFEMLVLFYMKSEVSLNLTKYKVALSRDRAQPHYLLSSLCVIYINTCLNYTYD